jgi:hypothetical protein
MRDALREVAATPTVNKSLAAIDAVKWARAMHRHERKKVARCTAPGLDEGPCSAPTAWDVMA